MKDDEYINHPCIGLDVKDHVSSGMNAVDGIAPMEKKTIHLFTQYPTYLGSIEILEMFTIKAIYWHNMIFLQNEKQDDLYYEITSHTIINDHEVIDLDENNLIKENI